MEWTLLSLIPDAHTGGLHLDRQHTLDRPCSQLWLRTKSLYILHQSIINNYVTLRWINRLFAVQKPLAVQWHDEKWRRQFESWEPQAKVLCVKLPCCGVTADMCACSASWRASQWICLGGLQCLFYLFTPLSLEKHRFAPQKTLQNILSRDFFVCLECELKMKNIYVISLK